MERAGARPGFTCDQAVYERHVTVPASWKHKVIKVEFTAVQFIADVYVDGLHVGSHVGGWIPFSFDVTNHVSPGKTFTLKVVVKGGDHAPVALFDKEYDDLGIAPVRDKKYPRLTPGRNEKRTLILYNDEFQGATVEVEVRLESGGALRARGSKSVPCVLGEHVEIPIAFQVPYTGGVPVDLILITQKNGIEKFKESKRFAVGRSGQGESSDVITFE